MLRKVDYSEDKANQDVEDIPPSMRVAEGPEGHTPSRTEILYMQGTDTSQSE